MLLVEHLSKCYSSERASCYCQLRAHSAPAGRPVGLHPKLMPLGTEVGHRRRDSSRQSELSRLCSTLPVEHTIVRRSLALRESFRKMTEDECPGTTP